MSGVKVQANSLAEENIVEALVAEVAKETGKPAHAAEVTRDSSGKVVSIFIGLQESPSQADLKKAIDAVNGNNGVSKVAPSGIIIAGTDFESIAENEDVLAYGDTPYSFQGVTSDSSGSGSDVGRRIMEGCSDAEAALMGSVRALRPNNTNRPDGNYGSTTIDGVQYTQYPITSWFGHNAAQSGYVGFKGIDMALSFLFPDTLHGVLSTVGLKSNRAVGMGINGNDSAGSFGVALAAYSGIWAAAGETRYVLRYSWNSSDPFGGNNIYLTEEFVVAENAQTVVQKPQLIVDGQYIRAFLDGVEKASLVMPLQHIFKSASFNMRTVEYFAAGTFTAKNNMPGYLMDDMTTTIKDGQV